MRITKINLGLVTMSLTAEDCNLLAEVCEKWDKCGMEREADIAHVETMGTALRMAAVLGLAQFCSGLPSTPDLEALFGAVNEDGAARITCV
jgi:hypothetical protein